MAKRKPTRHSDQRVTPESARHGWLDRPADVETVVSRMRYPVMGLAAGRDFLATEPRDVLLWELEEKLLGKTLPANRQTIGDCVSHGFAAGVRYLFIRNLIESLAPADQFIDIATEPIYALSRVEVGKGRLGNGDGSVGAWAAESLMSPYGVLQRKKYGSTDLTTYSGQRAKQWGSPRSGLPDDLEAIARQFTVSMAPLVVSEDEAISALSNAYPIPVCSQQGFKTTRDRYGFCDPRGSWSHCLCAIAIGYFKRAGKKILATAIKQSWGDSPDGPDEVELWTGRKVVLPQGVFLVEFDVFVSRMLRARDSFAPAGPRGFVKIPDFDVFLPK